MPVCYFRWTGRLSGTISVARRQIHVRLRHADMFMSFSMSQKIPKDLEVLLYKTNSFHFAVVSSVIDAQKTSERSISDNTWLRLVRGPRFCSNHVLPYVICTSTRDFKNPSTLIRWKTDTLTHENGGFRKRMPFVLVVKATQHGMAGIEEKN